MEEAGDPRNKLPEDGDGQQKPGGRTERSVREENGERRKRISDTFVGHSKAGKQPFSRKHTGQEEKINCVLGNVDVNCGHSCSLFG